MAKQQKVSLVELEEALKSADNSTRYNAMFGFAHSEVTLDAIPTLLRGLSDLFPGVVRYAAESLGRLGPATLNFGTPIGGRPQAVFELLKAACHIQRPGGMPEAYEHCLEALIKIDPKNPFVTGLIHDHIGLTNWSPVKASLQALQTIGTPEA